MTNPKRMKGVWYKMMLETGRGQVFQDFVAFAIKLMGNH